MASMRCRVALTPSTRSHERCRDGIDPHRFIQTTWFGDDTGKPMNGHKPNMNSIADLLNKEKYDLVIINSGWWDLKSWGEKDRGYDKCGEKWGGDCVKAYERDVQACVEINQ